MHKIPAHTNQHFCIYVVLCDMWAQAHIQKIANTCVKISRTLTLMPGLVEIWIVYDANLEMLRFKLIQGLAVLPVTRSNPSSKKISKKSDRFSRFSMFQSYLPVFLNTYQQNYEVLFRVYLKALQLF